jgi:hypothetical protein
VGETKLFPFFDEIWYLMAREPVYIVIIALLAVFIIAILWFILHTRGRSD